MRHYFTSGWGNTTASIIGSAVPRERGGLLFLREFVKSITLPVVHDGREHIEYVPTQVLTEYFRQQVTTLDGQRWMASSIQVPADGVASLWWCFGLKKISIQPCSRFRIPS